MKPSHFTIFFIGLAIANAEEQVPVDPPVPEVAAAVRPQSLVPAAPQAWLGLEVSKPDRTITSHIPDLPPGIGFIVRSIDKDGPAATAGLKEFDLIWKIGDQMLVNEGQLAALLRLTEPGEEVMIAGFRGGQPIDVKLKLGVAPISKRGFPSDVMDSVILPGDCGGPMRVVNVSQKLASYSNDEGRAEVRKEGEGYQVKIHDPQEELIFEGKLPADGNLENVPAEWQRRVHALRRGLDHALAGGMMPGRQPRPRVVPPTGGEP